MANVCYGSWIQPVNATLQAVWRSVHMKRKPRIYYSDSQKALMWERWRQGDSLQKIAQLFDRNHS
jgi:hypothetical protein